MKKFNFWKPIIFGLIFIPIILIIFLLPISRVQAGKTVYLSAPLLIQDNSEIGQLLDNEAGISAYYQASGGVDLNLARNGFRTIEVQNSDYIIGSVDISNYDENHDVHVYVHKNGWLLAYYLNTDPSSKMVDIVDYSQTGHLTNTKLKSALSVVASAAGIPFSTLSYYDFRYPNATNLLLVGEDVNNGNDFTINMPNNYGYYERSWVGLNTVGNGYFVLDGVTLFATNHGCSNCGYYDYGFGKINPEQLQPDVTHTIQADDWGILVVTYRVP